MSTGIPTPAPCPFCGGPNPLSTEPIEERHIVVLAHVVCPECNASGPDAESEAEAIEAWNGRQS